MHNIVASGGVCQDLVLHFCVDLAKHNVSMAALDVFQRKVKGTRLSKTFFEDRVAGPPSMSIKAFASEILDVVSVLCLFAETVLKPIKEMLEFTHLLDLMAEVLDILTMGDAAVAHTPRLQDLLLQYHTALLRTAPEATRPKLHYIHHTPGQIARLQANLSCFAPERKHHVNKESLRHIFKDMEPALAVRNAYDVLWLAQHEPKCFQQFTVGGTEGVLRGHISAVVHERFGRPLAGFTWLASSSFKCGLSFILNTKKWYRASATTSIHFSCWISFRWSLKARQRQRRLLLGPLQVGMAEEAQPLCLGSRRRPLHRVCPVVPSGSRWHLLCRRGEGQENSLRPSSDPPLEGCVGSFRLPGGGGGHHPALPEVLHLSGRGFGRALEVLAHGGWPHRRRGTSSPTCIEIYMYQKGRPQTPGHTTSPETKADPMPQ